MHAVRCKRNIHRITGVRHRRGDRGDLRSRRRVIVDPGPASFRQHAGNVALGGNSGPVDGLSGIKASDLPLGTQHHYRGPQLIVDHDARAPDLCLRIGHREGQIPDGLHLPGGEGRAVGRVAEDIVPRVAVLGDIVRLVDGFHHLVAGIGAPVRAPPDDQGRSSNDQNHQDREDRTDPPLIFRADILRLFLIEGFLFQEMDPVSGFPQEFPEKAEFICEKIPHVFHSSPCLRHRSPLPDLTLCRSP